MGTVISYAMLSLAIKRLASRPGLTLLLILSAALTIGLVTCVPVFVDAISLQILQEEIARKMEAQHSPPFPVTVRAVPEYGQVMTMEEAVYDQAWIADRLSRAVGLPIRSGYIQNDGPPFFLIAPQGDPRYKEELVSPVQVTVVRDLEAHLSIVEGAPYGAISDPTYLHAWLDRAWAEKLGMQVGDQFTLEIPLQSGVSPLPVRIVGIWEPIAPDDRSFWPDQPAKLLEQRLLTTEAQYLTFIHPMRPERTYAHLWYFVLDDRQMSFSQAEHYVAGLQEAARELEERVPGGRIDFSPLAELQSGLKRRATLSAILFSFSLPLLAMLFYLMISVAGMAARSQRQEVAVLASRGSGRLQILGLKATETLAILLLAAPLGLGAGLLLAHLMGYVKGFLVFAPIGWAAPMGLAAPAGLAARAPTAVHIQSVDWRLVIAAVAVGAVAQLWPHLGAARLTIVTYERWAARRGAIWSGVRLLWTAALIVVTVYAYRRLVAAGALSLIGWQPGAGQLDPLPLLAPSLFLFTTSVVASQLFVLLVRPMALVGYALPSVAGYLGFTVLGREGEQYRAPIFLIVLCLSLGVFFASLGKSADQWLVDRRSYEVGADLTLGLDLARRSQGGGSMPQVRQPDAPTPTPEGGGSDAGTGRGGDAEPAPLGAGTGASGEASTIQSRALLLPISEYDAIPGVAKAARVGEYRANLSGVRSSDVRLLAVDRLDFGRVIYFRPDYAEHSLGELMNRLGERIDGLLIPVALAEDLQVGPGDPLVLNTRVDGDVYSTLRFTIVDTFTHFPTMYGADRGLLVVGNLDYLQMEMGGAIPYRVWMRVQPGAETEEVLDGVQRMGVLPLLIADRGLQIALDQQRLERVGMFGMLSFCFLASAVLAGLGLLVHRFASLMGQRVRYAVWQAMGMDRREIMAAASIEYLLTLGYGILLGAGGGFAASLLYVPLYRLTDQMVQITPPFIPLVNWQAGGWIVAAIGLTFVLIEATTLVSLSRLRVFEALRMGSRE